MKLDKRIEYLSLSVGNAKSHQVSEFDGGHQAPVEFLTQLDEKLEVANVQLEIYELMKGLRNLGEDGKRDLEVLGTNLLDITAVSILAQSTKNATNFSVYSYTTNMRIHTTFTI